MSNVLTKDEIQKAMQLEGKARGVAIKEHLDYILEKKGRDGVKRIEEALSEVGYPGYREISSTKFYPLGFYALTHAAIKKIFHFKEEDFEEMGRFNAKFSLVIRLFMRYFVSVDQVAQQVSKMWRRYYSVGTLTTVDYNEKEGYVVLKLKDFSPYPTYCSMVKGYFSALLEIVVKKEAKAKEARCTFRGDNYHEFLLTWK